MRRLWIYILLLCFFLAAGAEEKKKEEKKSEAAPQTKAEANQKYTEWLKKKKADEQKAKEEAAQLEKDREEAKKKKEKEDAEKEAAIDKEAGKEKKSDKKQQDKKTAKKDKTEKKTAKSEPAEKKDNTPTAEEKGSEDALVKDGLKKLTAGAEKEPEPKVLEKTETEAIKEKKPEKERNILRIVRLAAESCIPEKPSALRTVPVTDVFFKLRDRQGIWVPVGNEFGIKKTDTFMVCRDTGKGHLYPIAEIEIAELWPDGFLGKPISPFNPDRDARTGIREGDLVVFHETVTVIDLDELARKRAALKASKNAKKKSLAELAEEVAEEQRKKNCPVDIEAYDRSIYPELRERLLRYQPPAGEAAAGDKAAEEPGNKKPDEAAKKPQPIEKKEQSAVVPEKLKPEQDAAGR